MNIPNVDPSYYTPHHGRRHTDQNIILVVTKPGELPRPAPKPVAENEKKWRPEELQF